MDFHGTALVTGSATGIGRSLAVALAREGMDVALLDVDETEARHTAKLVAETGRRAEVYPTDVSERAAVEASVGAAWDAQGPIRLTCANAGVFATAPLLEMEERDLQWLLCVNVFGALDTVRASVARAREAKTGGHVLLTGSENSIAVPHAIRRFGVGMYGMTKHAILQMADVLRYELAADGFDVSVLLPGPVSTELLRGGEKRPAGLGGPRTPPPFDPSVLDPNEPMPPTIEPDVVGRIAMDGLRAGRFMIPTHAHLVDYAQARVDELAEATRATAFEPGG